MNIVIRPVIVLCLCQALLAQEQVIPAIQVPTTTTQPQNSSPTTLPKAFTLEDGTPVKLRINRTVSSADAQVGDTVDFEVLEEIQVNDVLVVPKGGLAFATVTEAQAKRRMARGGKLDINIDYVRLVSNEKAALRAVKEVKGGGHTGAMTGAIVATSLVFWPAAPFFLFMHGKEITIPKGTELTAYVNGDMKLDVAKFSVARAPSPANAEGNADHAGATASAATAQAQLQVSSTPDAADIEIDGSFVGNTPSTVGVAPGQHQLSVKKTGFKPWERKITVSSGQVNVNAVLEPEAK
jgi:hypothetical protein